MEYLGRADDQVKVRGFRIELGEIEAGAAASTRACARRWWWRARTRRATSGWWRTWWRDVDGGRRALRAHLRRALPEYMVPSAFVRAGRAAADAERQGGPQGAAGAGATRRRTERYVAPRTPAEEVLAEIWAEVLRLERVGVDDNFFELGGHSLLATQVVSRVREAFGVELPLRALFEAPTVAELAERVEAMRRAGLPVLPPVVPVERTGALPLSFAQERLWFLDQLEPGSAVYNIPVALRLGGALDVAALERALDEIVRRHEALRTTFAEVDGAPVQVIAPFGGFALPVEDLSALGEAEREAAVQAPRRRGGARGRSTSRRARCSARRCCGWARRSTCCC